MKRMLMLASLALALPTTAVVTTEPSLAAGMRCLAVLDGADGPQMETLCVDADRKVTFGEPVSYFGDVSKCGRATLEKNEKLTLKVDLSACAGDLPSHRIVCPPMQSGPAECVLTWTKGGENRPVVLK